MKNENVTGLLHLLKSIALWIVTVCFVIFGITAMPSVWGILLFLGAAIAIPLRPLQNFWSRLHIHGAIKVLALILAFLIGVIGASMTSAGDTDTPAESTLAATVQTETTAPTTVPVTTAEIETSEPTSARTTPTEVATQPVSSVPPTTAPKSTQAPSALPPVTQPQVTKPPATQPPATQSPETEPPTTQPPETEPPTQPPTTKPPAPSLHFVSTPGTIGAGNYATVSIQGAPNTSYSITVYVKSGPSEADGLGSTTSDADGYASWTWKVGARSTPGTYSITVSGGGQKISTSYTIS